MLWTWTQKPLSIKSVERLMVITFLCRRIDMLEAFLNGLRAVCKHNWYGLAMAGTGWKLSSEHSWIYVISDIKLSNPCSWKHICFSPSLCSAGMSAPASIPTCVSHVTRVALPLLWLLHTFNLRYNVDCWLAFTQACIINPLAETTAVSYKSEPALCFVARKRCSNRTWTGTHNTSNHRGQLFWN